MTETRGDFRRAFCFPSFVRLPSGFAASPLRFRCRSHSADISDFSFTLASATAHGFTSIPRSTRILATRMSLTNPDTRPKPHAATNRASGPPPDDRHPTRTRRSQRATASGKFADASRGVCANTRMMAN
ncbi:MULTISPECIES: hypothetical protein [Burkholderia]|uniref:hypothetical protein n=1 Tax=Burkholderia TaxID=32008 RepID=UPI0015C5C8F2